MKFTRGVSFDRIRKTKKQKIRATHSHLTMYYKQAFNFSTLK